MIDYKVIIFDLGGVFLNLDEAKCIGEYTKLGFTEFTDKMKIAINEFQTGEIDENEFRNIFRKEGEVDSSDEELDGAWNSLIGDIPQERLMFLMDMANKYQLCLLSNIDPIHMKYIEANVDGFDMFIDQFPDVYYSYEVGFRKPDMEIYLEVLMDNGFAAEECLFVDDKLENIEAAQELGFNAWHVDLEKYTVLDLKDNM